MYKYAFSGISKPMIMILLKVVLLILFTQCSLGKRPPALNYNHLNLVIKNQGTSLSCWAHSLATLTEAYFKRNKKSSLEWSGYDIYYCHSDILRGKFPTGIYEAQGKAMVSATCSSYLRMSSFQPDPKVTPASLALQTQGVCAERLMCTQPTATVTEIHFFEPFGNSSLVFEMLQKYGPLMVLVTWTKRIESYSESAGQNKLKNPEQKVFYKKNWPIQGPLSSSNDVDTDPSPYDEDTVAHAVTLVGFDYDRYGDLYWILHNSHGKKFGFQGQWFIGENELDMLLYPMVYLEKAELGPPLRPTSRLFPIKQPIIP